MLSRVWAYVGECVGSCESGYVRLCRFVCACLGACVGVCGNVCGKCVRVLPCGCGTACVVQMSECVRMWLRECVGVCVCACVGAYGCVWVGVRGCECVLGCVWASAGA